MDTSDCNISLNSDYLQIMTQMKYLESHFVQEMLMVILLPLINVPCSWCVRIKQKKTWIKSYLPLNKSHNGWSSYVSSFLLVPGRICRMQYYCVPCYSWVYRQEERICKHSTYEWLLAPPYLLVDILCFTYNKINFIHTQRQILQILQEYKVFVSR